MLWKSCHGHQPHHRSALLLQHSESCSDLSSPCKHLNSEILPLPGDTAEPWTSCGFIAVSAVSSSEGERLTNPLSLCMSLCSKSRCATAWIFLFPQRNYSLIRACELPGTADFTLGWCRWCYRSHSHFLPCKIKTSLLQSNPELPSSEPVFHSNHHSKYGLSAGRRREE